MSVFVGSDQNEGEFYEETDITQSNYLYGGYAQTKWLSEYVVNQFNFPKSIYRFGLLTGNSKTGKGLEQDYLGMFLKALAKMKCVPQDALSLEVDITPIDIASQTFLDISITNHFSTYHIANQQGTSLYQIVEAMNLEGYTIEVLNTPHFLVQIAQTKYKEEASLLKLAFCKIIASQQEYLQHHTFNLFQASNTHFDHQNTQKQLLHYTLKGISNTLLRKYIRNYFVFQ